MTTSNPLSASLCRTGNPDHRAHSDRMPPLTPPSPSGRNAQDFHAIETIEFTIFRTPLPQLSIWEWIGNIVGAAAPFVALLALLFIAEGVSQ